MAKVALIFDIPDDELEKLIPSDGIYATISTHRGTVQVIDLPTNLVGAYASGTNAIIKVVE